MYEALNIFESDDLQRYIKKEVMNNRVYLVLSKLTLMTYLLEL